MNPTRLVFLAILCSRYRGSALRWIRSAITVIYPRSVSWSSSSGIGLLKRKPWM